MNAKLVILSGPSGVGKDTVINRWTEVNPRVTRVVAYTTRQPRPGEIEGVDYHFVTPERFNQMAENGDFLEFKQVHDYAYATPLTDMEKLLAEGKIAILKIDVQGARAVMPLRPDAISIFILPPDDEELERRLRSRATDDPAVIAKRLKNARDEIAQSHHYQYRIINTDVEETVAELERIVH